jgi:hypothetical protein
MHLSFGSAAAALPLLAILALSPGCGPAARATPTRSVDASSLYVGLVHWSPSEVMAHGVVPAFPRDGWVALVAADGYVRHGRVGGSSRHECDHCVGPRTSVVLSIDEPPSTPYAIGPAERRLGRVTLIAETPYELAAATSDWAPTASFDLDEDGTADLERVERCGGMVPTGCDERLCSRHCAASRTVGESEVRGELCTSIPAYPQPCLPRAPEPEVVPDPAPEPEPTVETPPEGVSDPSEDETEPRRRWGSRRRPR